MEDAAWTFNLCEGVFWLALAVVAVVMFARARENRDLSLAGVVVLAAFGLSDFVEMRTGAWYNPWWLLVWKACCLAGLAAVFWSYQRRRRRPS